MCGIVGFTGKERAVPYLLDCLSRLEYRGYDSAGIALNEKKGLEIIKRKGNLSVLTSEIYSKKQSESCCGIGHTRWATHGRPDEKNAHPHVSENGYFAVVHNGIIENYESLRNELVASGYHFRSETDTEVIAHLLEKYYEGDFVSAVKKTLERLEGSYAVAVLCKDFPDKIFCSRWGSPIVLAKTDTGCFISSDVTSILKYTNEIYKLDGGESALVDSGGFEFFNKDMKRIAKSSRRVNLCTEDAEKGGFEHFMLKEIFEQPDVIERTVGEYVRDGEIAFDNIGLSDEELREIKRIAFIACGSAYHAGLTGKYVTEALADVYCSAEIASEWRYENIPLDKSCLCVFISQSGETADTLAALRKANEKGAKTISVVNVVESSVASESNGVIYTRAGAEIAVATTKAYAAQLAVVYLFAIKLAGLKGLLSNAEQNQLLSELERAGEIISSMLERLPETAQKLADELYTSPHMYFIGRSTDCAAAMEGALKLKEVSYIPCEAYAAGELKHGTISLIEKGTSVVALACNDKVFSKTLSNIREVSSRGARVIALCSKENEANVSSYCDKVIPLESGNGLFSALYEGVMLQLFAYYTAKKLGRDIDKPRNLAKSVTVE